MYATIPADKPEIDLTYADNIDIQNMITDYDLEEPNDTEL